MPGRTLMLREARTHLRPAPFTQGIVHPVTAIGAPAHRLAMAQQFKFGTHRVQSRLAMVMMASTTTHTASARSSRWLTRSVTSATPRASSSSVR